MPNDDMSAEELTAFNWQITITYGSLWLFVWSMLDCGVLR